MAFNKPCIICGTLSRGTRCPEHQQELDKRKQAAKESNPNYRLKKNTLYGYHHQKARKIVKATATECWICKQPFTATDSIDADHLYPGDPLSPLLPAHSRCNRSRGNTTH